MWIPMTQTIKAEAPSSFIFQSEGLIPIARMFGITYFRHPDMKYLFSEIKGELSVRSLYPPFVKIQDRIPLSQDKLRQIIQLLTHE